MAANPVSTTLADLRSPVQSAPMPIVRAGFNDLQGFELMQRGAKAFASSTLVPAAYQGNVPNCIIALDLAQRIGASPLMVAQNLYIVHGRPSWSSQFLIAAVNQCGRFTALQYEWSGKEGNDDWTCRAVAKDKATGERVQGPAVSIAMAKKEGWYQKSGSKWQSIPELMLMYRAATFFARTNAPELTMGLSTAEEAHDIIDVHQTEPGRYETTMEGLKPETPPAQEEPPAPAAAEDKPKPARSKPRGLAADAEFSHAGAPPPITDEAVALLALEGAKDEGEASAILDQCKGQPFYASAVVAFNRLFATVHE